MDANFMYSFLFLWILGLDIEVNCKDESKPVTLVICENKKSTIQCPEKEVNIIQAFFGRKDPSICPDNRNKNTNCSISGVKSRVMKECFSKDKCEVEAKTSIFGDACPETSKYLSIKYQCQDYPKHLVICEGYQKTLKCPSNHHVDITMGFYGRRNNVTCFRGRVSNTRCSAGGVKSKLSEVCKGRTVCDVDSNSSVFGDPCWRTSKYLQLKYRCIPVVSPIPPSNTVAKPRKKLAIICDGDKKPLRCLKAYGGVIEVLKATYGRTNVHKCVNRIVGTSLCKPVNVLSIVKKKCDNKNVCQIFVPNKHFGDPCSNTTKYATIVYHCRKVCTSKQFECSIDKSCIDITHRCDNVKNCADASDENGCHPKPSIVSKEEPLDHKPSTAKNNVIICIDDDNRLLCDKEHNTVISVKSASYGRNSIRNCPEGNIGTTSCGPKNILQKVKQQCNGKHLCRVTEPDEDPCPGTTKYFKIAYDCVKGS